MPIYEYECRKCSAHIEIMQKMTDKPLTKCTKCGGRLEKQWSSTSFQLKGTGWYVTDYAAKKTESKSETKEAKPGASDGKTKADDKPSKDEGKGTAAKKETTSGDKSNSTSKKSPSKSPSTKNSSD